MEGESEFPSATADGSMIKSSVTTDGSIIKSSVTAEMYGEKNISDVGSKADRKTNETSSATADR